MKTSQKIIEEFVDMGARFALSLIDGTHYEGYIEKIHTDSIKFVLGGPLVPEEPIDIPYESLDFNSFSFFDPSANKYKDAKWSEDEDRWIISDYKLPDPQIYSGLIIKAARREAIFQFVKEFAIILPVGIFLGILTGKLVQRFHVIDESIIDIIIVIVSILFILVLGYLGFKYFKAVGEDDVWD